jgi:hypothetical protein
VGRPSSSSLHLIFLLFEFTEVKLATMTILPNSRRWRRFLWLKVLTEATVALLFALAVTNDIETTSPKMIPTIPTFSFNEVSTFVVSSASLNVHPSGTTSSSLLSPIYVTSFSIRGWPVDDVVNCGGKTTLAIAPPAFSDKPVPSPTAPEVTTTSSTASPGVESTLVTTTSTCPPVTASELINVAPSMQCNTRVFSTALAVVQATPPLGIKVDSDRSPLIPHSDEEPPALNVSPKDNHDNTSGARGGHISFVADVNVKINAKENYDDGAFHLSTSMALTHNMKHISTTTMQQSIISYPPFVILSTALPPSFFSCTILSARKCGTILSGFSTAFQALLETPAVVTVATATTELNKFTKELSNVSAMGGSCAHSSLTKKGGVLLLLKVFLRRCCYLI